MNQALNAVRFANSSSFADSPKMASKSAKRAFLRHLADMSRWSCEVHAYLEGRQSPKCDHHACRWLCFQSELETADELSMSQSAVKRTRRALVADGWITLTQETMGRGSITFYDLDKDKLGAVQKQKHERRVKLPASLRPPDPPAAPQESTLDLFDAEVTTPKEQKNRGNLHPLPKPTKEKGGQSAPTPGATCTDKGGNVPSVNKKNRKEPVVEPNTPTALAIAPSESDVERVYQAFPRKVGKPKAIAAIRTAIKHLGTGKDRPKLSPADAVSFLFSQATIFARSPAGNADEFTPHPATWFNQARYLDDEKEWQRGSNQEHKNGNRGQARIDSTLAALRRADAADANSQVASLALDRHARRPERHGAPDVLEGAGILSR